jgi:hypothetical protein
MKIQVNRLATYDEVAQENQELIKKLNNKIKSGELTIKFAPDFYLYDVISKLGNSHPTKYLNNKRMEVFSSIHSILTSIDDQTVNLYKEKFTPEQDTLYQTLNPYQKTLGIKVSTRFIGELAISSYNTNKLAENLSSEGYGTCYGERTLDVLSQAIERIIEYPLIEAGTRNFNYGFVVTPNTLFHYLEEQKGEVVLNHEFLVELMSRLANDAVEVIAS